jgi:hypothetical protein
MKPRTAILAALCMAACWYYAACFWASPSVIFLKHSDFYPLWNGGRDLLQRADPYSRQATEHNDIAAYGSTEGAPLEQRFPYPVYATFSLLPLSLLDFRFANQIAFWLFAALTALSVGWLRGKWDSTTALYGILTFSSFPVIFALQIRQPTLFYFGLVAGSFALIRPGHLIPAAILAALSAGKPQVALPVLLALLIWSLARWHERKWFAISLATALLALLSISQLVSPGWIPKLLAALRAYSQYAPPSLVISFLGPKFGLAVSGLMFLGLIAILWLRRQSDLLAQTALSVVVIHLIVPYQFYNAIMLLIPALWIADNAHRIAARGAVNQITLAAVRIAFVALWLANAIGAVLFHLSPMAGNIAVQLPPLAARILLATLVVMMLVQCFPRPLSFHPIETIRAPG